MPWLIKDADKMENNLFFVHVPRCGGTSLMHHFDVPQKVMKGRSLFGKFGMVVFFARYKVLESSNFPILTWGNFFAFLLIPPGIYLFFNLPLTGLGLSFVLVSVIMLLLFTFVFTAPTICRITPVRRCYLIFVNYILCNVMESIPWCTGTNRTGYIMHLTAHKLLAYRYVTAEEMDTVCTMAIVRNPYARMVSLYHYNRFGCQESFAHFVEHWYKHVFRAYREDGELDEWYTACHAIPQFEFTHFEGKQLVRSIVKQEELKYLKAVESTPMAVAEDSTVADLPDVVRKALLGMPHTNQRKTDKKWYDYYDQRTLDLVHEMYATDFVIFNYDPVLTQRPDLKAPHWHRIEEEGNIEHMWRDSWSESGKEERRENIERSIQSPVSHVTVRRRIDSNFSEPATTLFDLTECAEDSRESVSLPSTPSPPREKELNSSVFVTPDSRV